MLKRSKAVCVKRVSERLRKKAKTRLLTRAAQKGPCAFAAVYGAATVRESVAQAFFRSL
jgi:hypothetical protein